MPLAFNILAPPLHETANAAATWFRENWGITAAAIRVETAFHDDVAFRPTFMARLPDHHWLAVEVSEAVFTSTLDAVVLDCRNRGVPVKLVVAVHRGIQYTEYAKHLRRAKELGVGILEVDANGGQLIQSPLSQSVAGVRRIDLRKFPSKSRHALQSAEQTFRDGQPSKACSTIYEQLEAYFRRFCKKCKSRGVWNPGTLDIDKAPWATLITHVDKHLDRTHSDCAAVTSALLARLHGVTTQRNDSGHVPSQKRLIRRDRELGTRFESGVDLFDEFREATRPFRI